MLENGWPSQVKARVIILVLAGNYEEVNLGLLNEITVHKIKLNLRRSPLL